MTNVTSFMKPNWIPPPGNELSFLGCLLTPGIQVSTQTVLCTLRLWREALEVCRATKIAEFCNTTCMLLCVFGVVEGWNTCTSGRDCSLIGFGMCQSLLCQISLSEQTQDALSSMNGRLCPETSLRRVISPFSGRSQVDVVSNNSNEKVGVDPLVTDTSVTVWFLVTLWKLWWWDFSMILKIFNYPVNTQDTRVASGSDTLVHPS
jgi:hypothetical protein